MSDSARVLAVCDLLTDQQAHLDTRAILDSAAEHVARLTRCDLGIVAMGVGGEPIIGSYPRSVTPALLEQLIGATPADGGLHHDLARPDGTRTARFGTDGLVLAVGSIDEPLTNLDEWLVMMVARRVEAQLEVVQLHTERLARAEIVQDAILAGELQRALLPAPSPRGDIIDVAARLRPARHVGGDLYDFQRVGHDVVALIADVSGKGMAASLLTASVHVAARRAITELGTDPAAIVERIRFEVAPLLDTTARLVTVAVAATDVFRGELRIANAGHSPVVVRNGDHSQLIVPGAPPLGTIVSGQATSTVPFGPGDTLVLASDGFPDQRDPAGNSFGLDRMIEEIAGDVAISAQDSCDHLFDVVHAFADGSPQDDDQTAVVISHSEPE